MLRSIPLGLVGARRGAAVGVHADAAQGVPVPVIMTVTVQFTLS